MERQVIHIHPSAPPKPAEGAPCNGCGVCCLVEPCPIGALISRRRTGACTALIWSNADRRYRCGVIEQTAQHLPRPLTLAAPLVRRWALRMISAGSGCDCSYEM